MIGVARDAGGKNLILFREEAKFYGAVCISFGCEGKGKYGSFR